MKLGVLTVALGDMSLDAACKFLSEQGVQSFWLMKTSRKSFWTQFTNMVWRSVH